MLLEDDMSLTEWFSDYLPALVNCGDVAVELTKVGRRNNPELGSNHLDSRVVDEISDVSSEFSAYLGLPLESSHNST